jgi:hypothetical protein
MNTRIKTFAFLGLSLILTAAAAQAQSDRIFKAKIPFEFIAGEKLLPAGDYTVRQQESTTGQLALLFRSADSWSYMLVAANWEQANGAFRKSKMTFHCYAKQCFASDIVMEGELYGVHLLRSRAEAALQRSLRTEASNSETRHPAGRLVAVALLPQ